MMRFPIFFYKLLCFAFFNSCTMGALLYAQGHSYKVHALTLPPEVAHPENQFSAIQVYNKHLYLISESRLQENAEAKMYAAPLGVLKKAIKDTAYTLPFIKYSILHLDILRAKMKKLGNDYEGLEATIFENNTVYFSVETETNSPDCYIIKGELGANKLILDTNFLIPIPKFTQSNGKPIYNACYEAMVKDGGNIYTFYEYNAFPQGNFAQVLDRFSLMGNSCHHLFPMQALPFRITDITAKGNHHYTAINFFYKGDGADAVYRPAGTDSLNNNLVFKNGQYHNYARLIDVHIQENGISWQPIGELPEKYQGHNWECIAAYKKGYFLMNDKYTTVRPNKSTLLYLAAQ
ncbi:MAG: hypothetical protein RIR12_938 [Bacteroidota bacterium]